jgi:hypothetical protein
LQPGTLSLSRNRGNELNQPGQSISAFSGSSGFLKDLWMGMHAIGLGLDLNLILKNPLIIRISFERMRTL